MLLLRSVVRREGVKAIVATHDPMMLDVTDDVVELADGRLVAPGTEAPAVPAPTDGYSRLRR